MGLLFKTYNGKHQMHVCRETWVVNSKQQLDDVFKMFSKKETPKVVVRPVGDKIELEFADVIVDCGDIADVKVKFGLLADLKMKYQKLEPAVKVKK